jgi:hypothetical protein
MQTLLNEPDGPFGLIHSFLNAKEWMLVARVSKRFNSRALNTSNWRRALEHRIHRVCAHNSINEREMDEWDEERKCEACGEDMDYIIKLFYETKQSWQPPQLTLCSPCHAKDEMLNRLAKLTDAEVFATLMGQAMFAVVTVRGQLIRLYEHHFSQGESKVRCDHFGISRAEFGDEDDFEPPQERTRVRKQIDEMAIQWARVGRVDYGTFQHEWCCSSWFNRLLEDDPEEAAAYSSYRSFKVDNDYEI